MRVSADPAVTEKLSAAIRGRFQGSVDDQLFTTQLTRSLNAPRAKDLSVRIRKYAPPVSIEIVKRENVDGKDTITCIAKTSQRIFLWRLVIDESGKIAEMSLDEEE